MTLSEFSILFPDDVSCLDYLFCLKERICPLCKGNRFYHQRQTSHYVCMCGSYQISPMKGTIFEGTKVLRKFFQAIYLFSVSKNGIAAKELQRQLGISYPTALRMGKVLRSAMREYPALCGEVEVDEAVFGGRKRGKRGRGAAGKTIMFGAKERGGKVYAAVIPNVSTVGIAPHFNTLQEGSNIYTDALPAYKGLSKMFNVNHHSVDHWRREYVRVEETRKVHTNGIESFWGQVKRSLHGTHHSVTPQYLDLYLGEHVWRYNRRQEKSLFWLLMKEATSKRPFQVAKPEPLGLTNEQIEYVRTRQNIDKTNRTQKSDGILQEMKAYQSQNPEDVTKSD